MDTPLVKLSSVENILSIQLFNPGDIDEDGNDICADSDEYESFESIPHLKETESIEENTPSTMDDETHA